MPQATPRQIRYISILTRRCGLGHTAADGIRAVLFPDPHARGDLLEAIANLEIDRNQASRIITDLSTRPVRVRDLEQKTRFRILTKGDGQKARNLFHQMNQRALELGSQYEPRSRTHHLDARGLATLTAEFRNRLYDGDVAIQRIPHNPNPGEDTPRSQETDPWEATGEWPPSNQPLDLTLTETARDLIDRTLEHLQEGRHRFPPQSHQDTWDSLANLVDALGEAVTARDLGTDTRAHRWATRWAHSGNQTEDAHPGEALTELAQALRADLENNVSNTGADN